MKTSVPSVRSKRLLLVTALSLSLASRALSVDLLVYNNNDSGAGSLRQAISDNNGTAGGNTIIFSNVVTGTITLTSGKLVISENLTIIGPGANVLAVSGNHASRVFDITYTTVSISGLTISNGSVTNASPLDASGGGILNDHSTLTLNNCTLSGNSARSGGGVCNTGRTYGYPGTLTLNNCTLSGNSASTSSSGYGGAIYNDGSNHGYATLTLNNCTLSGNSAYSSGSGYGGGIYNDASFGTAMMWMTACTLSDNSAPTGGGIYNIALGGGTATLEIGDTILKAGAFGGVNIYNDSGTITSDGYNLSSDHGSGFFIAVGDQINTDPMLGPLQDQGGQVPTMVPLPGSPAIDQGKSFGLTTDQRGRPRRYDNPAVPNASLGDGSDIGAVEVVPVSIIVSNTNDSGAGSLRQAILNASPSDGDTITFATNVAGTITLTTGELLITKDLTLPGPGANVLAVSGNAATRVFHVSPAASVHLSGLTITNGHTTDNGGGILNDHSTLFVRDCALAGNSASYGGGIFNAGASAGSATLTMVASTFSGNSAGGGGAIFNDGGFSGNATLTLTNCTLSANSACCDNGGGIYNWGLNGVATCALWGCTLSGNTSGSPAGGVFNYGVSGSATATFANTILNAGASGANVVNSSGIIGGPGYNLSSDNPGAWFQLLPGDQWSTDPRLGPLQDNGGPTLTHTLLSNSPAIDKGKSFGLATDQRGEPRPFDFASIANASGGDGSDIGAFELGRPTLGIQRVGSSAVLSWPWFYGGFTLQSSTNVASSNAWISAGGADAVVGNQHRQTNGPISGHKVYRLKGN